MASTDFDVIIIGAGFSGLAAADRLNQLSAERIRTDKPPIRFIVLEGATRPGGRTFTVRPDYGYLDMGGQYLAPRYLDPRLKGYEQTAIWNLIDRFGVEYFPTHLPNNAALHRYQAADGTVTAFQGNYPGENDPDVDALVNTIEAIVVEMRAFVGKPSQHPRAGEFDAVSVQQWMDTNIRDARRRELFTVAIRSAFSVEPSEVSLLHLFHYAASCGSFAAFENVLGGGDAVRFRFGTNDLVTKLVGAIGPDKFYYGKRVLRIFQDSDHCEVTTRDSSVGEAILTAERVIVAMSPSASAAIDVPGLDIARQSLTEGMPMAHTIKGYALYKRPWWRDAHSGYVLSARGPADWMMDNTWEKTDGTLGQASLMTFIVGNQARRWGNGQTTPLARATAVREQIRAVFTNGETEESEFINYIDWDWGSDEWSYGCPAGCVGPNVLTQFDRALYAPLGRIHWSGSEAGLAWMGGYMNGAVDAGIRTAEGVAALL